ncbi:hypothetical protein VOLCADRAFT_119989 [Volvox carteri f. nagariensis]|uniref:Receptor L-domain domain-containing protein n=1 Tax=Volvox carteri f. nagariensis TaxID=3068 RepID=D8UIV7_VOLCA|nr:uncharacterized protein VOLCADRAFT_119989 [Volvox carteri f. nagariensis]EFJ40342.1 hypothetical protein VOLCADRAFT_119989 [Volvox carteri f. nagariensis]|eukprot:XP_002958605.1 hypothetical protein VOLCADRAFT_119989 [Volvox carteri f. nagariensis]
MVGQAAGGPVAGLLCRTALCALATALTAAVMAVTVAGQASTLPACAPVATLVLYAGSGGYPYLRGVYDELPLDKKGLLPLGQGQVAALDLEAPRCSLLGMSSWPSNLLLYDNGTLSRVLPNAMASLGAVGGTLMLYGHPGLDAAGMRSLQSLRNVKSATNLLLYNLDALTDLLGLEGFTSLPGDLYLGGNGRLRWLGGLEGLREVGGDLALLSNMALSSVQGLQNLQVVRGQLLAIGNGKLTNLLAMASLTSVGSLRETNNGAVQLRLPENVRVGLAAAGGQDGGGEATLLANAVVQTTSSITTAIPGAGPGQFPPRVDTSVVLLYSGSTPDLEDVSDWLKKFDPPVEPFEVREYNTRAINLYDTAREAQKLSVISGSLVIWASRDLGQGLWPLSGLTAVYGQLVIVGPPDRSSALETLQGLDNLQYVGGLHLLYLQQLRNLTGLGGLGSCRGDLNILQCPSLPSTRGLAPLTSVYTDMYLVGNTALWDIAGLKNIRSVGGTLHLQDMPYVKDLEGLSGVRSVYGHFVIQNCSQLTSTSALRQLSSVGSLRRVGSLLSISDNSGLKTLSGLSALTDIGEQLLVARNPQLYTLADMDSSLKRVGGGGIELLENPALTSLGRLPTTLERVYGPVVIKGPVAGEDVAAVQAKSSSGGGGGSSSQGK